ncbi:TetR/AcrR family transcriptional regulator [Pelagivirga sediminicola]|uniref:TetR/AcrR family transcriptional regulator n=1 Tax=Pelagivirga sediminicola TaxID=2170575 RepID=A0A2T7G8E5_9RHOB|nr:TetR/AcrR family transcriptional regulator [Pelagivirga sediminicola]PVA10693.1 TetR/AcrR family transcriptional regulator [Pelagivirga sediminicola]
MNIVTDPPRAPQEAWLKAAYDVLTEDGVEAVKIMPLAKRMGVTRSGFYWHFSDREALLEAMIAYWEDKNTGNLVARCDAYAETICEAVLNLFDCWLDDSLFDSRLDLAIRNWARNDAALAARLERADARRKTAIEAMFLRFGYAPADAEVRTLTMIYTQIGYISMQVCEEREPRFARMADYVRVFTGWMPSASEMDRFRARHEPG